MDDRLRLIQRRGALSGFPDDEAQLLVERLRAGELTHEQVLVGAAAGIKVANLALCLDPEDARRQCEIFLPPPGNDLFLPIHELVKVVWALSQRLGWGFTADDILSLPVPTSYPNGGEHNLTTLVLVPYLDTVHETFDGLWQAIQTRHTNSYRWDQLKSDPANLRLLDGITHPGKCLRWEAIDLGANWDQENGIAPRDVRNPVTSPHVGTLAAAALHTNWVEAMDGTTVPRVWLSGYECKYSGRWSAVPWLGFLQYARRVLLSLDDDYHHQYFAVPAL